MSIHRVSIYGSSWHIIERIEMKLPTHYSFESASNSTLLVVPFKNAISGFCAPSSNQLIPTAWLFRFVVASRYAPRNQYVDGNIVGEPQSRYKTYLNRQTTALD